MRSTPGALRVLRLAVPVLLLGWTAVPFALASASGGLTITPLTWNVIGLDSNDVTAGPDQFPVGARVCNGSGTTAAATTATFDWDSAGTSLAVFGPSSLDLGDLAAGDCADAYFNVQVTRSTSSYNTSRQFHVTAASGELSAQTPANRELYVEKLISQNRNGVDSVTSTAIDAPPGASAPGHATVYLGQTYLFHVDSHTATGGYEQIESAVAFPTPIFRVLKVAASYSVPSAATNTAMYADACGWDDDVTSGSYRSCVGPAGYPGGKAGGKSIGTDYTVQVVGTGTGTISTLIYDFSGSSFHYNANYGDAVTSLAVQAVDPPVVVPPVVDPPVVVTPVVDPPVVDPPVVVPPVVDPPVVDPPVVDPPVVDPPVVDPPAGGPESTDPPVVDPPVVDPPAVVPTATPDPTTPDRVLGHIVHRTLRSPARPVTVARLPFSGLRADLLVSTALWLLAAGAWFSVVARRGRVGG
jgi:hypothetical protein